MRVVILGMGVQGRKRLAIAGRDVVATIDPVSADADHRDLTEVPLADYDAALICTPDEPKLRLLTHLLSHGKHALVEKPLAVADDAALQQLAQLAARTRAVLYTAYNHRFEPHFIRMRDAIASGALGKVYFARLFYGNGTARLVRESAWRDTGTGVLADLGSHLIDTVLYWFGKPISPFILRTAHCFENRAFDHVIVANEGSPSLELEMTLLSWRNHFTADVFGELGSAHIESLCKWGPSTFTLRRRVLPSGRPPEESVSLAQADPTWVAEYAHFKTLCATGDTGNIANDVVIHRALADLQRAARAA